MSSSVFGVGLGIVAFSALTGMTMTGASPARLEEAKQVEDRMERAKVFIEGKIPDPSLPLPAAPVPTATEQTSENTSPQEPGVADAGQSRSK